jgi:hypothetical protein
MAQNSVFDVKIPEGHMVQFNQEATFENFIGQFQPYCSKLLCVIDGTILRYYDKMGTFPSNIRFDYKQRRGAQTEYYFRNIGDDTLYCVFGRESALIFYPRIDEVDPSGRSELVKITKQNTPIQQIPSSQQKRPTIVEPIIVSSRPDLNRNINRVSPPPVTPVVCTEKQQGNQTKMLCENTGVLESRGTVTTRVRPMYKHIPNNIVIVDKGVKLVFPNPNYPIEIKKYLS